MTGHTYILDPNPTGLLSVSLTFQEEAQALMSWTLSPDEAQWLLGYLAIVSPQYWSKVEWPVGLDNVYRFTPGPYGIPMRSMGWWESKNAFVIHSDLIGNTERLIIQFIFEGDRVTFQMEREGFGLPVKTCGRLED